MISFRTFFAVLLADLRWAVRFWLHRLACVLPQPARQDRDMSATALNDRRGSGMRCKGYLGRPTVVMLG